MAKLHGGGYESRDGQEINLRLLDTDLADLTVARAQQMIGVIQRRPLTFESGKSERMKTKQPSPSIRKSDISLIGLT